MVSSSSVAFLLSLLVLLCLQTAVYSNTATKWNKNDKAYFVNDNVIRTIDVSSNLVREKRAIAITRAPGTSDSSSHPYYIAVELPKGMSNASVAFIAAKDKDSDSKLELAFAGEEKDFPSRQVLLMYLLILIRHYIIEMYYSMHLLCQRENWWGTRDTW